MQMTRCNKQYNWQLTQLNCLSAATKKRLNGIAILQPPFQRILSAKLYELKLKTFNNKKSLFTAHALDPAPLHISAMENAFEFPCTYRCMYVCWCIAYCILFPVHTSHITGNIICNRFSDAIDFIYRKYLHKFQTKMPEWLWLIDCSEFLLFSCIYVFKCN